MPQAATQTRNKKKIAVVVQNFVQYYALKKFIDTYSHAEIHLFVPQWRDDVSGFGGIFDAVYDYLKSHYKTVFRGNNKEQYDILLEPYYIDSEFASISAKYRLKYKYSAISAKTNPSYRPEFNSNYDAILCYSNYEKDLLSVYAKTFLVGKLNYCDFKKIKNKKKTLLYLPTYGAASSLIRNIDSFVLLKKHYKIIAKLHHGTTHLVAESGGSKVKKIFDEVYDEKTPLEEILKKTDLVISDNSGSIFEAIYVGIPVCTISAEESNGCYGSLSPLQDELRKKGIIPFREDTSDISSLIKETFSRNVIMMQRKFKEENFPLRYDELMDSFTAVIDYYIRDNVSKGDMDGMRLRKILADTTQAQIDDYVKDLNLLQEEIAQFRSRRLYRVTAGVYDIIRRIRGEK